MRVRWCVPNFTTPVLSSAAVRGEKEASVAAPNVSSLPLDNMCRVLFAVQEIMTELSGAMSEEAKILAITKIVFNLMKDSGK
jgi:hypothetical protein